MKRIALAILLIGSIYMLDSCYYDKGDVLVTTCDTSLHTYGKVIRPILDHYCVSCHNNNNPTAAVSVEDWEDVKQLADEGRLLGVIRHEPGYVPMPLDQPQMIPCDIRNVELWVADGAPNN